MWRYIPIVTCFYVSDRQYTRAVDQTDALEGADAAPIAARMRAATPEQPGIR